MPFVELLLLILNLYTYVVFATVIMSWLFMFGIINTRHPLVQSIWGFCQSLTEPLLRRIRRVVHPVNGIDLSPIILLLGIWLIKRCIVVYVYTPMMISAGQ